MGNGTSDRYAVAPASVGAAWSLGLNKILGTIHTYPTLAEANKYAAGEWKRAHAPHKVLAWLGRFHTWMRG
ncbi:MAG: hypothetical protein IPH54_07570 [Rhodoferax sp.]|nr:hypothetical protein [Rhodoferax sp.]